MTGLAWLVADPLRPRALREAAGAVGVWPDGSGHRDRAADRHLASGWPASAADVAVARPARPRSGEDAHAGLYPIRARPPGFRPGLLLLTAADLEDLAGRAGLAPAQRLRIRAAAAVAGFSITSYAADELIDWQALPEDPIWRLFFPDADLLPGEVVTEIASLCAPGAPGVPGPGRRRQARPPRAAAHQLGPGEPVLPGVHRSYHDTVRSASRQDRAAGRATGCPVPARPGPACHAIRPWPPLTCPG